jgi:hypothetical protein
VLIGESGKKLIVLTNWGGRAVDCPRVVDWGLNGLNVVILPKHPEARRDAMVE